MRVWIRLLLAVLILFGVVFGTAFWIGTVRWNSDTKEMIAKLGEAPFSRTPRTVSFRDLGRLPAPVARYFRMALTDHQPLVRSARVRHEGMFLPSLDGNRWIPFRSEQYFSANPPGFVWAATMRMAPLMDVRVRDAYLAGKGEMEARTFALIPVLDVGDQAELNAAALQRYLAEAIWFPTALLPGGGVTWKSIDASRARATLTDSGTTVSLEFRFNDKGEVTEIYAPGRYREVEGKYVLTPWRISVSHYEERAGMRIPLEGEAAWQIRGGVRPYWKGRIVDVRYDFAQ